MKRNLLGALLLALILAVLFWPTLQWLVNAWFDNEYYSHGVLLPFVSAYLLWNQRHILSRPHAPAGIGLAMTGLGLAIHLGSLLWSAYYLSALALVLVLAGLAIACYGLPALRKLGFPLAFLTLAVPLPFVPVIATYLQVLTAENSTNLSHLFGVPAVNLGGEVRLPGGSLVVGAPCSGMNSLITLITLSTLFIYVMQTSWRAIAALVALVIPLAIAGNTLRVTSLLVVANQWGVEAGLHFYHDISGWVFYALVLSLLGVAAWGLGCRDLRYSTLFSA